MQYFKCNRSLVNITSVTKYGTDTWVLSKYQISQEERHLFQLYGFELRI